MTAIADRDAREQLQLTKLIDSLAPRIGELSAEMDAQRQLPADVANELKASGVFKMFVPRDFGGLEMDPLAASAAVESLSRLDASLGWNVMIGAQAGWFAALLEPAEAREIYGPADAVVGGALKPGGQAQPVDGGYRVSGRWQLASGCTHATWLYGTCVVVHADSPAPQNGMPELRVVFMPVGNAEILDTWRSTGLRGTGSHDFVVRDLLVPNERTFGFPGVGAPHQNGPLYRDRLLNFIFVCQAGQALGMARGALDAFIELAPKKQRWGSDVVLRDEPAIQAQVADAEVLLSTARAWLVEINKEVWLTILEGGTPSMVQRVRLRMAITHAIRAAERAVGNLHAAAGSSAIYEGHPLERRFRDIHTAAAHVQATPRIMELAGATLLGLDWQSPGLI